MFCAKCGGANDDNAYRCTRCGEILHTTLLRKIDNHLALAIVVTVLCCLPFGIVGVVHAAQVNGKAQAGDIAGAEEYARKAKMWSMWGLGIGLAVYGLYGLAIFASAVSGAH